MPFNPTEISLSKSVPWGQSHPTSTAAGAADAIRRQFPSGVDAMIVAVSSTPGWLEIKQPNGIIAILIGLLLPAVQKVQDPKDSSAGLLRRLVKPGGRIGVAVASVDQVPFVLPRIGWETL